MRYVRGEGGAIDDHDKVNHIFIRQRTKTDRVISLAPHILGRGNEQPMSRSIHLPQIQQPAGHPKLPRQRQLSTRWRQACVHKGMDRGARAQSTSLCTGAHLGAGDGAHFHVAPSRKSEQH